MSTSAITNTGSGPGKLNSLPRPELVKQLLACLDVPRWANEIADQRPFHNTQAVYTAADDAALPLQHDEIHRALAAHPRIGEREPEPNTTTFSSSEQSGVDTSDAELSRELRVGNEEYERRFGHVYL